MARDILTDEQVEQEIQRLLQTEEVRLARKEQQVKYKRRQYMYGLRNMEKRGRQLKKEGITFENLEQRLFGNVLDEEGE